MDIPSPAHYPRISDISRTIISTIRKATTPTSHQATPLYPRPHEQQQHIHQTTTETIQHFSRHEKK